jgi:transcriptional antiterminator RfaH
MMRDQVIWYAVHTGARAEWLVHSELRRQGFETLYLHYLASVAHAGRKIGILRPYFPRYLFVGLKPGQSIGTVNNTAGVSAVVYFGDEPLRIPDHVIAELRGRGDQMGRIQSADETERKALTDGAEVRIISGPFAGLLATVARDKGKAVQCWIRMFGHRTRATVSPDDVEPLDAA